MLSSMTQLMVKPKLPQCTDLPVCLTAEQTFAPLKNSYGAVWEGSLPAAPPLDMQVASGGQTLLVRYARYPVFRFHVGHMARQSAHSSRPTRELTLLKLTLLQCI